MKIFISWSGKISLQVATILKEWIPDVLHNVEPFISTEIGKGKRWGEELAKELESTDFGIICVTRDNLSSPWLNFEAGALSKTAGSNLCTLAFGLKPSDITSPLDQFQATKYEKEDIKNLVSTLNSNTVKPLEKHKLDKAFDLWWPQLFQGLEPIYQLTKRKVVWVYEELNLTSDPEIQKINREFSATNTKWYLDKDDKPNEDDYDVLIYVYGKSAESQTKLRKIVNFATSLNKEVPLIIYTRYASGDKRLSDEEFEIALLHGTPKIANMLETLVARFQEVN